MISNITMLAGLVALLVTMPAKAGEKLEPGKGRIDVPAMGPGLWVHNLFQSNMILQRDKPIRVWGWAEPGEKITVTFGAQSQSTTAAADRSWKVQLPAMPASAEPRRLVIQGQDKKVEMENILVGDVWLLGGQSNMEFEIPKVEGGQLEVVSANFRNIRLFSVPQLNGPDLKKSFPRCYRWSDWFGQHYREGYWDVCTPESVREMSAIGYVFARRLHMATQIPIGLIDASRGGTCLETWTPLEVLEKTDALEVKTMLTEWDKRIAAFDPQKDLESRIKDYDDRMARLKAEGKKIPTDLTPPSGLQPGPAADMNRPGNCYASMIAPIAGYEIKGAIWHQGYNNALQPNGHVMYAQVFPSMIKAWRDAFNDPTMPFGIITQETEGEPQTLDDFLPKMVDEGTYIRETHFQTFLNLRKGGDKNIGYASSFDQHRAWFHPQIKIPVGERMACWALATQYGKPVRWLPPQLIEVKSGDGKLVLKMDCEGGPFHDGPNLGFAIAGQDGHFQPARAEWLDKNARNSVVLTSPLVPEPLYFRYAWGRNPLENLKSFDHTDLPFDTQRNDTWSLADMYEIYTGKKAKTAGTLDRAEHGELIKALKADDLKRRLEEAKALLKANGIKTGN
jgi:sialate O-acetylesterase